MDEDTGSLLPSPDLFGDEEDNLVRDCRDYKTATMRRKFSPPSNNTIVIGKFPRTVCMTTSPLDEEEELKSLQRKAELLMYPPDQQETFMMRWRFSEQQPESTDDGENTLETNSHLVEWEDGSLTLFIGTAAFDIDVAFDKSYILEDSEELKPFHAAIDLRLQARQSNFCQGRKLQNRKFENLRKQRVNLTSHEHAARDELRLQKRINKSFTKSEMNIQFLESDF